MSFQIAFLSSAKGKARTDRAASSPTLKVGAALIALAAAAVVAGAGCASSGSSASARNAQGVQSFTAGRYDDAIAYFQESLNENPESAETYYNLASAYQRKAAATGDTTYLAQAEDSYWTALEHNPKPETIVCCYRGLATSAEARGDSEGALRTLEAWRDRNPTSIEPQLEIAYLLEAQQKDAEAYDVLKQVASAAPDDYRAFYKLGTLSERAGDLADAKEQIETARKLNPTDALVARRASSVEAQIAAQEQKKSQSPSESNELLQASNAPSQTNDSGTSQNANVLQTTPVQTTAAQSTLNSPEQEEGTLYLPSDAPEPENEPTTLPNVPSPTDTNSNLGFGSASSFRKGSASTQNQNIAKDDLNWITPPSLEKARQSAAEGDRNQRSQIAAVGYESATTNAPKHDWKGSGITSAQFEVPAFARNQQEPQASIPQSQGARQAQTATPSQSEATALPSSKPTVSARQESVIATPTQKPRAELRSGPPRLQAGAFF